MFHTKCMMQYRYKFAHPFFLRAKHSKNKQKPDATGTATWRLSTLVGAV